MLKLKLEKAEEQEIRLPTLLDHRKCKRISEKKIYFCFIDYIKAFEYADHNKLWKIIQEIGVPDHLTSFLRNLYAGQEETVRTGHETTDWFQIGKGVYTSRLYVVTCLFNFYTEYIM